MIDIIVLGFNHPEMTDQCIESIRKHTEGDYQIVYVDNGSNSGMPDCVDSIDRMICLYNNEGFARGMNIGISCAREGSDIVTISNDCIVTKDWLPGLVLSGEPGDVGIVSPQTTQCCMSMTAIVDRIVDWMPAVCWYIKRATIHKVGLFDPAYDIGWMEDKDYCYKVNKAGLKNIISSRSYVDHIGSYTSRRIDYKDTRGKNKQYFKQKWGVA